MVCFGRRGTPVLFLIKNTHKQMKKQLMIVSWILHFGCIIRAFSLDWEDRWSAWPCLLLLIPTLFHGWEPTGVVPQDCRAGKGHWGLRTYLRLRGRYWLWTLQLTDIEAQDSESLLPPLSEVACLAPLLVWRGGGFTWQEGVALETLWAEYMSCPS